MLTGTENKQRYFDRYWQTRDLPSADARSVQRASLVGALLGEPDDRKLIDVGCGRGTALSYLAERGFDISGCDISPDTVSTLLADGRHVFICDIEKDPLPGNYDGILCLEVLQQLFDPAAALEKFARAVTGRGVMIISVPNEFHLAARLRLLFGKSHLGHFDESHIRLFNPRRAHELIERVGLSVEKAIYVPVIPPRAKGLQWLGKTLARLWPDLFSLSIIIKVRKP